MIGSTILSLLAVLGTPVHSARQGPFVADRGGLLTTSQEESLAHLLEAFTVDSTYRVSVVTVPSLGGQPLEVVARRVAREWSSGEVDPAVGILFVASRDERVLRWEVGREAADRLTDGICGRIARELVKPQFDDGQYFEGLRLGIEAAHAALEGDLEPLERSDRSRRAGALQLGTLLALAVGGVALGRRSQRRTRATHAAALPYLFVAGVGREAGFQTSEGGGGETFEGAGSTGGW